MDRLAERLGVRVEPVEAIGFDGDAIEAQCFAYLGLRSRQGAPLSFPTTTGVPKPMTGGRFWPAAEKRKGPACARPRPIRRTVLIYWQTLTGPLPIQAPFGARAGGPERSRRHSRSLPNRDRLQARQPREPQPRPPDPTSRCTKRRRASSRGASTGRHRPRTAMPAAAVPTAAPAAAMPLGGRSRLGRGDDRGRERQSRDSRDDRL